MKKLSLFILLTSMVYPCNFQKEFGNIESINMNGDVIYTNFRRHLYKQSNDVRAALGWGDSEEEKPSPEEVRLTLNLLVQTPRNKESIQNSQESVDEIHNTLTVKNISWIGVETSQKELENANLTFSGQIDDYHNMRDIISSYNVDDVDAVLALLFEPRVIVLANRKKEFSNFRIIPLDDNVAKEQSSELVEEIHGMRDRIITLGSEGNFSSTSFLRIMDRRDKALAEIEKIPQSEIDEEVAQQSHPLAKKYVIALYDKVNQFIDLSKQRDETAARLASEQTGNGLILFGLAHGPGIRSGLLDSCEAQSSSPPSSGSTD